MTADPDRPFDAELDARDLLCPLPVLKARKRLLAMKPGQILRVLTTDPVAVIDLPHFCAEAGQDYLGATQAGSVSVHHVRRAAFNDR
tara:strand:- start:741 stop:1001 length:261 start_codon:yes stop_codon:yes gene_type:complete